MNPVTRSILRFTVRALLTALPVVLVAVAFYIVRDPFKVVRSYDNYFPDPVANPARVGLNKGVVSLDCYLRNSAEDSSQPINAIIFGCSVSCYYDADEWASILRDKYGDSINIRAMHFDSSSETPQSLARKVAFLAKRHALPDYALIVLDPIILAGDDNDSPYTIEPPALEPGLAHFLKFHYTIFRAATNADFLKSLIYADITGQPGSIGHNPIFEGQPIVHDPRTNQESIPLWDSIIAANPEEFYNTYPLIPPTDTVTVSAPVLTEAKVKAFTEIAQNLSAKSTDLKVIVSPNRRGVSLSPVDLQTLQNLFGADHVFDFSASHARDLRTDTLLYDNTHYRPPFASRLMHSVYRAE
ncbi:MAG: hypothetical protein HDS65_00690 [Bacteroidales bacterium]|nr:hypothetical protein [Bacteroidales bacterium]